MSSWLHLGQALLMGGLLGVIYEILHPLRPRWFSDLLFLWALFFLWTQLVFGLCDGDLRFAYSAALLSGTGVWHLVFGAWLQPVFSLFWQGLFHVCRLILLPLKKNMGKNAKIAKFSLCNCEKIGYNKV